MQHFSPWSFSILIYFYIPNSLWLGYINFRELNNISATIQGSTTLKTSTNGLTNCVEHINYIRNPVKALSTEEKQKEKKVWKVALMSLATASTRWQRDGQRGNNCSRRRCQRIDHLSGQHHSYSQSWHCQIQPIRPSWKCLPKVTLPIRVLIMLLKDENTTDSVRIFSPLVLNVKF